MSELVAQSLATLARTVETGEASCRDVVAAFLERIDASEAKLGAFLRVRGDDALREADQADSARAAGKAKSALHGLPIALKDNLVSPDFETTCASRILTGFRAPYEATTLARVRKAGMTVIGVTNMDEFAMGSSCENSSVKPTANPWDTSRVPGGSSGGSAACVAARQAPVALGSDTGGSIRQPAALCGTVGLKPTYGRVSRYGLVAFASSLDQIGPLTRTVEDAALVLEVIAGHDPADATSLDEPVPAYTRALTGDVQGLRIGIPAEFFESEGVDPETLVCVRSALTQLEARGAKCVEVSLPHTSYGIAAYYLIANAEAASNLSRYDGVRFGLRVPADELSDMYDCTRSQGFGPEVKRRILLGTFVLSAGYYDAYYRRAQQVRTLIRRDFEAAFGVCDLLATPTAPAPAWLLGERVDDPLAMYLSDAFTVTVNLAGLPAVSVPCGFSDAGLPIGLQLIGPALEEARLLRAADAYQRDTDWHERTPSC